jgi:hypothetical protein
MSYFTRNQTLIMINIGLLCNILYLSYMIMYMGKTVGLIGWAFTCGFYLFLSIFVIAEADGKNVKMSMFGAMR